MSDHELAEPFERLLADACTPATVRAIEGGADPAPLWARLEASGFVDTMVPESAGGAGLRLADAIATAQARATERAGSGATSGAPDEGASTDVPAALLRTLAYITQFAPTFSLRGGTREVLRGLIARGLGLR